MFAPLMCNHVPGYLNRDLPITAGHGVTSGRVTSNSSSMAVRYDMNFHTCDL